MKLLATCLTGIAALAISALAAPLHVDTTFSSNEAQKLNETAPCTWCDPHGKLNCDEFSIELNKGHISIRGMGWEFANMSNCDQDWTSFETKLPFTVECHPAHQCEMAWLFPKYKGAYITYAGEHLDVKKDKRCRSTDWYGYWKSCTLPVMPPGAEAREKDINEKRQHKSNDKNKQEEKKDKEKEELRNWKSKKLDTTWWNGLNTAIGRLRSSVDAFEKIGVYPDKVDFIDPKLMTKT